MCGPLGYLINRYVSIISCIEIGLFFFQAVAITLFLFTGDCLVGLGF